MVNKIKTKGVRRNKYSKIKKYSKYRKHHTRKFRKRTQRRVRRQTRNKRGGGDIFNLSLKGESNLNANLLEVLYKGFALVEKTSNFISNFISRESRRQVIICKLKGPKWVILKCRDDTNCRDNVLNGSWGRPYKIYNMNNLKEIDDKNRQTTYFEYNTDIRGNHRYKIQLTEGVGDFHDKLTTGIENLRSAIKEQKEKEYKEPQYPENQEEYQEEDQEDQEGDQLVVT
jgi:hypothetical protein